MIGLSIGLILLSIIFCICCVYYQNEKTNTFISHCKTVDIGMTKDEVIYILGNCYTKNVLANGEEKYVWSMGGGGSSFSNGHGTRTYVPNLTRKISVYFKDGVVSRYTGLNLD